MVYRPLNSLPEQVLLRIIQPCRIMSSHRIRRILITAAVTSLLSACATQLPVQRATPTSTASVASEAQQAYGQGDYAKAATLYMKVANTATPSRRGEWLLKSARSALNAHSWKMAATALQRIDRKTLNKDQRVRESILIARLDIGRQRPRQALAALPPAGAHLTPQQQATVARIRASALFLLGQTVKATEAAVAASKATGGASQRAADNQWLWKQLQKAPLSGVAVKGLDHTGSTVHGWVALATIARSDLYHSGELAKALQQWQQRYPNHPANPDIPIQLRAQASHGQQYPRNVALLLPLKGDLSAPASAVRDGFLTAYYARKPADRPQLRVYTTHPAQHDAAKVFQKALEDGADMVVGPLLPASVAAVAKADSSGVPVLALNYLPNGMKAPKGFYQLGLSSRDEVQELARRAVDAGLTKALALVPQSQWGQQELAAFRKALASQGGEVVKAARYNPKKADHSRSIVYLLGLSPKVIHSKDTAKLHLHTDADFIFVVATPAQGRLIRPELRFYNAGSLPVFATSSVYDGHPKPIQDIEMDGVRFCEMPWLLQPDQAPVGPLHQRAHDAWPTTASKAPRLVALGVDAFRVIPALNSGALSNGVAFPGVTGELNLGQNQRIDRRLVCAIFHRGQPQLLADSKN